MNILRPFLLSLAFTAFLISMPVFAQTAKDQREARILATAKQSAVLAGGARFCNVDDEMVEEFISLTDARIAVLAHDDYEKVLGRLEFKNIFSAYSAKMPEGGCEALLSSFNKVMREKQ